MGHLQVTNGYDLPKTLLDTQNNGPQIIVSSESYKLVVQSKWLFVE